MDEFTNDRVREVVDAVKAHCLRPCWLLGQRSDDEARAMHLKWAFPVFHVPFFSNTFVAAYLYAEALKILLGQGRTSGEVPQGNPAWIKDLVVQQEWSLLPLQLLSQYRFNMFFSGPDASTPNINHLIGEHVDRVACFSYSHTQAFTDSAASFNEIMAAEETPLLIVTDIPAEAEKVKAHAMVKSPKRMVKVVELGSRSVGSVLSDATAVDGAFVRLFFFGSPKTELFQEDIKGRKVGRQRHVLELAREMSLEPVKTELAIHFKYREDASDARQFLEKLSNTVQTCIKAANQQDGSAYEAAGPFFKQVVRQYNRLARSIAVGNQINDRKPSPEEDESESLSAPDFYAKSISNHA